MRLLLIRHGQTLPNVRGELDTAPPGAELTALGWAQATAIPRALDQERISGIYRSPRTRTEMTAQPLAEQRGLGVEVLEGLTEISAGSLEMRADEEARDAYADCIADWMHRDLARAMPGGETGHAFVESFGQAVRDLCGNHGEDDTVAVFSHGAAIRVYTALHSPDLTPQEAVRLSIMNTGAAVLEGDPDAGWKLARWSTDPLGGARLLDKHAHDVTGDSVMEEQAGTDDPADRG